MDRGTLMAIVGFVLVAIGGALWGSGWVEAARSSLDVAIARIVVSNGTLATGFALLGLALARIVSRRRRGRI